VAEAIFAPLAEAGINVDIIVQNVARDSVTDLSFTIADDDLTKAKGILDRAKATIGAQEVLASGGLAKVSIVGVGIQSHPGYAARMFGALAKARINIEMITTSEIRITCLIRGDQADDAARTLHKAFALERELSS
jgi:aspartate kinase